MENGEAAKIIRSVAQSIRTSPGQFHIEVTVAGQHIESHGGIGLSISAVGGGAGSSTIGQVVSLEGAQVRIAQGRGMQAANGQISALANVLDSMASQLESPNPDTSIIKTAFQNLKNKWVPGVITSVIGNVLTLVGMHFT